MELRTQVYRPSVDQLRSDRALVVRRDIATIKDEIMRLKEEHGKIDGSLLEIESKRKAEIEQWLNNRAMNLIPYSYVPGSRAKFPTMTLDQARAKVLSQPTLLLPKTDPWRLLREEYEQKVEMEINRPKAALKAAIEIVKQKINNLDATQKDLMFESRNLPGSYIAQAQETKVVESKGLPVAEVSQMVATLPAIEQLSPQAAAMVTAQATAAITGYDRQAVDASLVNTMTPQDASPVEAKQTTVAKPTEVQAQRSRTPLLAAGAAALYFLTRG